MKLSEFCIHENMLYKICCFDLKTAKRRVLFLSVDIIVSDFNRMGLYNQVINL
jgi:hypothetical protein